MEEKELIESIKEFMKEKRILELHIEKKTSICPNTYQKGYDWFITIQRQESE